MRHCLSRFSPWQAVRAVQASSPIALLDRMKVHLDLRALVFHGVAGVGGRNFDGDFCEGPETQRQTAFILVECVVDAVWLCWYSYSIHNIVAANSHCTARGQSANGLQPNPGTSVDRCFKFAESTALAASSPAPTHLSDTAAALALHPPCPLKIPSQHPPRRSQPRRPPPRGCSEHP